MNIGKAIKFRLVDTGFSQKWLADELRVTQVWISRVIKNKQMPSFYTLCRIANALDLKASQLISMAEKLEDE